MIWAFNGTVGSVFAPGTSRKPIETLAVGVGGGLIALKALLAHFFGETNFLTTAQTVSAPSFGA